MRYRIRHRSRYRYSEPVSLCHNLAHLAPRDHAYQRCLKTDLSIDPLPSVRHARKDYFGNHATFFSIQHPHTVLTVTATSEIVMTPPEAPPEDPWSSPWENVRQHLQTGLDYETRDARQYVLDSPFIPLPPELAGYAAPAFTPDRPFLEAVEDLMRRIYADFAYDPHFSTIATPLAEVLAERRGVCQDFAHLAIGGLRSRGLAARYVSGYLETVPPPGQARLLGADASHAWFSVFVPGSGWFDFDPTNNQIPLDQHITTAWGRDFGDVTPLKGVLYGGGEHTLQVAVDVERLSD
jgi:transglutaminase-like putative cysteine protease